VNGIDEVAYGNEASIYATKNRGVRPWISVPCPIVFGKGVSNALCLAEILTAWEALKRGGAVYTLTLDEEIKITGGRRGLLTWFSAADNFGRAYAYAKDKGWLTLAQGDEAAGTETGDE
jgi:hypothetical protein